MVVNRKKYWKFTALYVVLLAILETITCAVCLNAGINELTIIVYMFLIAIVCSFAEDRIFNSFYLISDESYKLKKKEEKEDVDIL